MLRDKRYILKPITTNGNGEAIHLVEDYAVFGFNTFEEAKSLNLPLIGIFWDETCSSVQETHNDVVRAFSARDICTRLGYAYYIAGVDKQSDDIYHLRRLNKYSEAYLNDGNPLALTEYIAAYERLKVAIMNDIRNGNVTIAKKGRYFCSLSKDEEIMTFKLPEGSLYAIAVRIPIPKNELKNLTHAK